MSMGMGGSCLALGCGVAATVYDVGVINDRKNLGKDYEAYNERSLWLLAGASAFVALAVLESGAPLVVGLCLAPLAKKVINKKEIDLASKIAFKVIILMGAYSVLQEGPMSLGKGLLGLGMVYVMASMAGDIITINSLLDSRKALPSRG